MFSEKNLEVTEVPGEKNGLGEELMRLWADTCLLQDMNPLQKRIFDWWTGEGFFNASNFSKLPVG